MTNPDAPENKAFAAANRISEQVTHLYVEAYTEGMRDGMEGGAVACQAFIDAVAGNYEVDSAIRDLLVQAGETIRDQIRLYVLQMPEPELPASTDG